MPWLRREDLEDRELRTYSRHAAHARDAVRRLPEPADALRTDYQRDRDRVIHSTAFRRLQHKTQVMAAFEGDHYRSRMTHTLEVSQMARGVARALRLNGDLAEAIALCHDLGHPPFGHVGEEALHELMEGRGGFRHNAQGLRIVDVLEERYGHGHGLNLTTEMRRSLLKGKVPDGFPVDRSVKVDEVPLEARVVDLCDRIAYLCHDLDDGLRAGVLDQHEVEQLELWKQAASIRPGANVAGIASAMVSAMIHDLVRTTNDGWSEREGERPMIRHSEDMAAISRDTLQFLREKFYRSRRVLEVMETGTDRIRNAFALFCERPNELPPGARERLERDGLARTVCDHVAGMTDRYLLRVTSRAM